MNWNQSFFDFSHGFSATKRWNTLWSDSPFFLEKPRRLKELKALWVRVETLSKLCTPVHLAVAFTDECGDFRQRWWMWNSGDWEWRLSERRGSVREALKGSVWEWEGEWERETGLCEKEGEWEWRGWVRVVLKCESESVRLVCVRERVSEST